MSDRDLLGPCGDYCGGCAEYMGLITDTARQLKESLDTYGYEYRSRGAFDFAEFARALQWVIDNEGCPSCQQGGGRPWPGESLLCRERPLDVLRMRVLPVLEARGGLRPGHHGKIW